MLCVCVMDVVFSVCIVSHVTVGARVWEVCGVSVTPYLYMLPAMYLFMAGITNAYLFVCGCLYITRF